MINTNKAEPVQQRKIPDETAAPHRPVRFSAEHRVTNPWWRNVPVVTAAQHSLTRQSRRAGLRLDRVTLPPTGPATPIARGERSGWSRCV
jgi:hypothetical protein